MPTRMRPNGLGFGDTFFDANGSAPCFFCRAFVNWNGPTNVINGSGNVLQLIDNGTGQWRVEFITEMPYRYYGISAIGTQAPSSTQHVNKTELRQSFYSNDLANGIPIGTTASGFWVIHAASGYSEPEAMSAAAFI